MRRLETGAEACGEPGQSRRGDRDEALAGEQGALQLAARLSFRVHEKVGHHAFARERVLRIRRDRRRITADLPVSVLEREPSSQ